jgi:hypothetical protein
VGVVAAVVVVEVGRAAADVDVLGGVTMTVEVTVEVTVDVTVGAGSDVSVSLAVRLSDDVWVDPPVRVGREAVALGDSPWLVAGGETVSPDEGRPVGTGRLPPPPHPLSPRTAATTRQARPERIVGMVTPSEFHRPSARILPRNRSSALHPNRMRSTRPPASSA